MTGLFQIGNALHAHGESEPYFCDKLRTERAHIGVETATFVIWLPNFGSYPSQEYHHLHDARQERIKIQKYSRNTGQYCISAT